jgi:CubicO group peptidase (beta-lactamase class C family)
MRHHMWLLTLSLATGLVGGFDRASATGPRVPAGHADLPHVAPADVGMSAERLARIDDVMRRAIEAAGFPGAAVIVGYRGAIVWERGYGHLDWSSYQRVDAERSMYDVASLTKVVATSAAAMVLVDRGQLKIEDPVARWLPEFRGGSKAHVTLRDLLTHRSGLPAGRDLARAGGTPSAARRAVLGTALHSEPGSQTVYSDLGPDVLGFVIERATGEPLDRFVRRAVHGPLGMGSTMFRPPASERRRIAPTGTPAGRGTVHDGNARALGGVAGHAGLFASAGDLAVFAQMMLDGGRSRAVRVVRDTTVALFTRRMAGWRALGWDTCAGGASCGRYLDSTAFGHTGFTGTSMWIDPGRELYVIVLTNWVFGRPWGGTAPVAVLHDARSDVVDLAVLAIDDGEGLPPMPYRLRSELQIGWFP